MSGEPPPEPGDDAARRVREVADGLRRYHRRYEADRDSRAVFAYAYLNLTYDLADRLATDPDEFDDPGWVADLAVAFGDRYGAAMDALDARERERPSATDDAPARTVPRPWADVHRAICDERSTVLEDLVFPMGAHVTYDLPNALVDVGTDPERLADYHLMNDVLASRTDAVQDAVTTRYNRTVTDLDRVAGDADEVFTNYWLRIGRSMAWYNALRLQAPASRAAAEGSIERSTGALIDSSRSTGPWVVRWGLRLYRRLVPLTRRWPTAGATEERRPRDLRW